MHMRFSAPAKINLHLRVGPPRADGYHPLLSWMCSVGLFDTLIVDRSPESGIHLECDWPDVPCGASNLVVKAAAAMADALAETREVRGMPASGLRIALQKRIPVGAGLGGGSSDGACILRAINRLWKAGWDQAKLAQFAAQFGSDLSFFFHAPSAICRGRGEIVQSIPSPRPTFAVLILPTQSISTAAAYRQFDQMRLGERAAIEIEPDFNGWFRLPALELLPLLVNDLEPAAFAIAPWLSELRRNVEQSVGRIVRMSGSGSSLFTLFDHRDEAEKAAADAAQQNGIKALAVPLAVMPEDWLNSKTEPG